MAAWTGKTAVCLGALMAGVLLPLSAQQAPKDLKATVVSPTKVTLTWTPGLNAKGHRVLRATGTASLTVIKWVDSPGASYTDGTAPTAPSVVYQVVATYNGSPNASTAKVTVSTAGGASTTTASTPPPSGTPEPTSPATVPSSPVASAPVAQATLIPLSTAQLAPARLAPAAAAPAAAPSTPAPAVSGKYRVVANGFSVVQQGHSHHDDVYGGFIMLHFDRQNGQLKNQDARRTKILGDINGRVFGEVNASTNRLRAGTASATGGLKNGDSYPNASTARVRGQGGPPPNRETFPFEVWTGDLTNNSDAVIILPTLWSRDGKTEPFDAWQNAELTAASQIWWDPAVQEGLRATSLGVIAPPGSATPTSDRLLTNAVNLLGAALVAGLGQPWAMGYFNLSAFDPSTRDRPIGLNPSIQGLPRRAIVLTREMIEGALNGPKPLLLPTMVVPNYPAWILPYLDVPVGVIPVILSDYVPPPGDPLRWTYVMYLQVERM